MSVSALRFALRARWRGLFTPRSFLRFASSAHEATGCPPPRRVVAFRSALIVCSLALAATGTAFAAGAETDEAALAAKYAAARRVRHELIERAVAVAAQGDATAAWKIVTADAGRDVTAETIGWRAATVAGFLRNQSDDDAAAEFTSVALAQRWQDLPQPRGAEKRAEAAY